MIVTTIIIIKTIMIIIIIIIIITYWYSRFSTWLQICNANAVTRAVTEARKQGHVPDFPHTIRDVQNVIATDENCEDYYFEDADEVAALEGSAEFSWAFQHNTHS